MKLGNIEIHGHAALAPMAGVADRAFRMLCKEYGAAFTVSEMVSAKGLCYGDTKSRELLVLDDAERPAAIQLFGDDPAIMREAAQIAVEVAHPEWIDINMGCPAPKIAGNHCGSALMREPALCGQLVKAAAEAVDVPVTAKMRLGYSKDEKNAVTVAKECEQNGAAAVTVHARTRDQMYAPPVDWNGIREVKAALSIPVIGNGDVYDAKAAAAMFEQTGCDMVMVGRGALGAPWVFAEIEAYLENERWLLPKPTAQRMAVLYRQAELAAGFKGEKVALLQARKHAAWYMRGLRGAADFRRKAGEIHSLEDLQALCAEVVRANEDFAPETGFMPPPDV